MFRFKLALLCILLCSLTSCKAEYKGVKADGYIITSEEDGVSQKWQNYLYNQLQKRANNKAKVIKSTGVNPKIPAGFKEVHIEIAKDLKNDYCVENNAAKINLRMHDEKTAVWMIYQLIETIGQQDHNFSSLDLPPSIIEFSDQCTNFDFSYRDVHLAPNLDVDYATIIGTNTVDDDWGIWAHNLHKVVKLNEATRAKINGVPTDEQYCFSSDDLYNQLKAYINDNYGSGNKKPFRFMIAPNDNDLVCTCEKCTEAGNDNRNATPAVINLINKLSLDFPKHFFYTLAYRTTQKPPDTELLDNSGVFISTIDVPKGIEITGNKKFAVLKGIVLDWKKKTNNLYLWDYISNFDDYLTPLPILTGFKKQFPDFKKIGIKGLFLNGSGYDYSPFDDVKTYCAAAIMMNGGLNADSLSARFFEKMYPVSHKLLTKYYSGLEQKINETGKAYALYGSFKSATRNYLSTESFITFYNALTKIVGSTSGEENEKLQKLLTALSFTRLQVAYSLGYSSGGAFVIDQDQVKLNADIDVYLNQLRNFNKYKDLGNFKENDGKLGDYILGWQNLAKYPAKRNLLVQGKLQFLSIPDEDYTDLSTLNDGVSGFSSSYHYGWMLVSQDDLHLKILSNNLSEVRKLSIRFLNEPHSGIYAPTMVQIIVAGKIVKSLSPKLDPNDGKIYQVKENLTFEKGTKDFEIKIIRNAKGKRTLACDEILLTK
ncbi:DUF4838 domain-containing protein [Pedobacter changchengzhani]|uniref:DUF4838 domain-containing protein n=1 Tax=Pedobacter changchengzhani TaxID=2529274 RepID=A0A4V3A097_9SPHI|nr:DUF4838 domain-containing protein [Pedobacter changchengzhani]TDG36603.1 DUF4838 domain-containing protein [Pedobacter changchengzhani]